MMDDHYIICSARNKLVDALKVLLNPEIMDAGDFEKSKTFALAAIRDLDDLLRQSDRNQA